MNGLRIILCLVVLGAGRVAAAQAPPAAPASSPASPSAQSSPAAQPSPIELKNKSSFSAEGSSRNPFWPIGWKPAVRTIDPNALEHGAGPDIPASAFVLSSITLEKNTHFAIINGKIMKEGQQFGLQIGNQTYQITLKAIYDGKVVMVRRDQEIVVPLRRK